MKLSDYIDRIREVATGFKLVGATPELEQVINNTGNISSDKLPFCFIVPLNSPTVERKKGTGTSYRKRVNFATIVVVDNKKRHVDGQEYYPTDEIDALEQQLVNAFVGWEPEGFKFCDSIEYVDGRHLDMVESRIWHQFDWSYEYYNNEKRAKEAEILISKVYAGRLTVEQNDGDLPAESYIKVDSDPANVEGCG